MGQHILCTMNDMEAMIGLFMSKLPDNAMLNIFNIDIMLPIGVTGSWPIARLVLRVVGKKGYPAVLSKELEIHSLPHHILALNTPPHDQLCFAVNFVDHFLQ